MKNFMVKGANYEIIPTQSANQQDAIYGPWMKTLSIELPWTPNQQSAIQQDAIYGPGIKTISIELPWTPIRSQ